MKGKKNKIKTSKKKMKVLIVAKQNKLGLKLAKKLENNLKDYIQDIDFDPSTARKIRKVRKKGTSLKKFDGDLVITIGGDGTLLWTAPQTTVPILPVRIEGYGFLCTVNFKELMKNIDRIYNKKYEIVEKLRLKSIKIKKKKIEKYFDRILHKSYPSSLNEIVFARKRPSKILEIEFKIDDTVFSFKGDGLLISTPAGSSAYSSSAGGSLLDPSLDAINIVPLSPFYSKLRPVVIPADKKIEVKIKSKDCALIIDGHGGEYIDANSEFIIERGEPVKIVKILEDDFYNKFKKRFLK